MEPTWKKVYDGRFFKVRIHLSIWGVTSLGGARSFELDVREVVTTPYPFDFVRVANDRAAAIVRKFCNESGGGQTPVLIFWFTEDAHSTYLLIINGDQPLLYDDFTEKVAPPFWVGKTAYDAIGEE